MQKLRKASIRFCSGHARRESEVPVWIGRDPSLRSGWHPRRCWL